MLARDESGTSFDTGASPGACRVAGENKNKKKNKSAKFGVPRNKGRKGARRVVLTARLQGGPIYTAAPTTGPYHAVGQRSDLISVGNQVWGEKS